MKVVVIGGGPGGAEAARRAARAGHQVSIIEQDRFGGTCTNRGCIPTKFLLAAVAQERARSGSVDAAAWGKIQARKKALVEGLSRKIEKDLAAAGVAVLKGRGELAGPGEVLRTDASGLRHTLDAEAVVLATGSSTASLPGVRPNGRRILTSDEVLELGAVPVSMVIIGSGFIGSEFAHLFSLLGTRVTLIEALPHILPAEDDDTSAVVRQAFERRGISMVTGTPVASVAAAGNGVEVGFNDGRVLGAELALVSVGRRPKTGGLGLEKVGLSPGRGGEVHTGPHLETGVPGVWAVGDIAGRGMLAHTAEAQGMVAAAGIGDRKLEINYRAIPYAIFLEPEVATVGLTEQSARALGTRCLVGKAAYGGNIKARLDMEQEGFIKLLADPDTGLLLGGTIVGRRAADMIHTLAVSIRSGLTAGELARCVFVHPTLSESFREAAENLAG